MFDKTSIKVQDKELKRLAQTFKSAPQKIPREIEISINATAKAHVTAISKRIRETVSTKDKQVKRAVRVSQKATKGRLTAKITIDPEWRPSLKHSGAKQTKPGASYQLKKKGRAMAPGSFGPNIAKLNNHVFVRVGKARSPIRMLRGVSPWGVYTKRKLKRWSKKVVAERLQKEIEKRIKNRIYQQNKKAAKA